MNHRDNICTTATATDAMRRCARECRTASDARPVNPRDSFVAVRRHAASAFRNTADKLRSASLAARSGRNAGHRAPAKAACFVPCNYVEKNVMTNILKVGVAAAIIALGAGCTDLKPLQAEVDSLKSQVSKLSCDVDSG